MDSLLLQTRLQVPPRSPHLVHRIRLVTAIERGVIDEGAKLVLVSAPAGYGKTTLLAEWARASQADVAWLSLGEEDNAPERIWRGLLASWARLEPAINATPLGLLLGSREPDQQAVRSAFINAGCNRQDHLVFVLDDAHVITDPAIYETLGFLLDHLPPLMHVVLASRTDPPLPLARYRARQELCELRSGDLQFHEDETAEFLNALPRLDLTADEIAALHARLEGWIAGLQLASLRLRRDRAALPVVSGRHRFIADYLVEEVLTRLPEATRWFLLQTSLLDRLCGPLCDAVTGSPGGQEMLEHLEQDNLFLMALDENREWFRYHRLFADVLLAELERRHQEDLPELHRRAARWHLQHDYPEEAFHHALRGDDRDLVAEILHRYLNIKLFGGELRDLQRWLSALPAAWFSATPLLGLSQAGLYLFTGALEECDRCLDQIERGLDATASADVHGQRARVTSFRCFLSCFRGDLGQAEQYASDALANLQDDDDIFRADIYGALGDTYRRHNRWAEARACYLQEMEFVHVPARPIMMAHTHGALADLELRQGHLRAAASHWEAARAAIQERRNWGRLPLPVIGWVDLRLGELRYEWNDLEAAWASVSRGLECANLAGDVRGQFAGSLLACRIMLTLGDVAAAEDALGRARPLADLASYPEWTGRFERCQLEVWLARGNARAARAWADAALKHETPAAQPERDDIRLALTRFLLSKGDPPSRERALRLLEYLLDAAAAEGRAGVRIEALALQALAHWQGGDLPAALAALELALRLAEPEGYVRLFADLGPPMIRLLHEAWARAVAPAYVARLVAAGAAQVSSGGGSLAHLEPLSAREEQVLGLLASGLTNREVAESLFISPETVKKHTSHIYDKLGVGNRMEAVARARAIGLLG